MLTGSQYRQSLEDGREVYFDGELVDVTKHDIFRRNIEKVAEIYDKYYRPDSDAISEYLTPPRSVEEIRSHAKTQVDQLTSASYLSLMTLLTAADRIETIRPDGASMIRSYVKEIQRRDLRVVQCITDAKGHRAMRPSKQQDPDAYLRVVERRSDGVVARGAKMHITGAPIGHELMTIPTKAMKPGEEDYAIAFSIPVSSQGVKIVNVTSEPHEQRMQDMPYSEFRHDPVGFVIYDDVFVPNERIFLNGEVEAAAVFAHSLGLWVRINGLQNMADEADLFCGFAQLMAEANGINRIEHIKDKIADLAIHATLVRSTLEASISNCQVNEDGVLVPDELYANAGKFHAAAHRTQMIQHLQDIAGGSLVTAPSSQDLENPDVGDLIKKYMSTTSTVDGAYRLRLFHALKDFTSGAFAGNQTVTQLHAGGGLYAQRVVTRARYDIDSAKEKAIAVAGLNRFNQ